MGAAFLLSACEAGSLGPEPRTAPAPMVWNADYDALLRAMHPGQPVDSKRREKLRVLVETLARMNPDAEVGTGVATLSPSAERTLREFVASRGGAAEIQRVLERLIAEHDEQNAEP